MIITINLSISTLEQRCLNKVDIFYRVSFQKKIVNV